MGQNCSEVIMKKGLIFLAVLFMLSACVTTPETVSIESTVNAAVDSAVSTALAPYQARINDFVTKEELETSQQAQNQMIQQFVLEQNNRDAINEETVPDVETVVAPTAVSPVNNGSSIAPAITPTFSYVNSDLCVDRIEFIGDVNIPDGMVITPYTTFTKTWLVKNAGDCTWNSNYKVVYQSGADLGTAKSFTFLKPGYFVKPGENVTISAELLSPNNLHETFITYWAMQSDRGEIFGAGDAKNVYFSSNFRVENNFDVIQNFASITCADSYGPLVCGSTNLSSGRGVVYYDPSPTFESGRNQGKAAIVVGPPEGENTKVRFEFGPIRLPRRSWFYTNFSCRPSTPHCDVQVRLYVREPGYEEKLVEEIREWNDGYMGEWKFQLDDKYIFDQEFFYILEVQANGGATGEDLITFANTKLY